MNTFQIAKRLEEKLEEFEFETVGAVEVYDVKAVMTSVSKVEEIQGFTIHIFPLPPEYDVVNRGGDVSVSKKVGLIFFDKREPGDTTVPEFDWHSLRTSMVDELFEEDGAHWSEWFSGDDVALSEVEAGPVALDGADPATLFALYYELTFE